MHICIDCRLGGSQHAGIGRYIAQLTHHLLQITTDHTWTLIVTSHAQALELIAQDCRAKVNIEIASARHYTIAEQLEMPRVLKALQPDVVHIPHFNVPLMWSHPRLIVTIHDLLWHEQRGTQVTTLPWWQYWPKYVGYKLISRHAVNAAKTIIVPSKAIRDTVTKFYPNVAHKVAITYEGATPLIPPDTILAPTARPTLVYIGSLYPHKNIVTVLKALRELPEYQLLLVGARSVFAQEVLEQARELKVDTQLKHLGYVPDDQLQDLLVTCTALVQPSISEGFGLPGVEAQLSGIPLVASDIPVFREVYGHAAEYFSPTDHQACAQAIRNVSQAPRRAELTQAGKEWAKRYQWSTMAQQTLSLYEQ